MIRRGYRVADVTFDFENDLAQPQAGAGDEHGIQRRTAGHRADADRDRPADRGQSVGCQLNNPKGEYLRALYTVTGSADSGIPRKAAAREGCPRRTPAFGQIEPPDKRPVLGLAAAERTVANPPVAVLRQQADPP